MHSDTLIRAPRQEGQTHSERKIAENWATQKMKRKMKSLSRPSPPPPSKAHDGDLGGQQRDKQASRGLRKAGRLSLGDSTFAHLKKKKKVRVRSKFPHARSSSDVAVPVAAGKRPRPLQHFQSFCPNFTPAEREREREAGNNRRYQEDSISNREKGVVREIGYEGEGGGSNFPAGKGSAEVKG